MNHNMHPRYLELGMASALLGERKDCAVISLAVACDVAYSVAHDAMAAAGRTPGTPVSGNMVKRAIGVLGFTFEDVTDDLKAKAWRKGSGITFATVGRCFPEGVYLARTQNHVVCLYNGQVIDWAAGRRFRVRVLYRLTKLGENE